MEKGATLSTCRKYRFKLWRTWDSTKPYALFIGLNPSTADETEDDPTINRCVNFSKAWGYGGVYMVNLFAYRATDPSDMFLAEDPIGAENDHWIKILSATAGIVIAAWGNNGRHLERSTKVSKTIPNLHCLKINKSGEPAHPLYIHSDTKPTPYQPKI